MTVLSLNGVSIIEKTAFILEQGPACSRSGHPDQWMNLFCVCLGASYVVCCLRSAYWMIGRIDQTVPTVFLVMGVTTTRPRQNGRPFPDDIFKLIFLYENVRILIKISLKLVPNGVINNIPALVQIMASHRPGDKPISEPMMVNLLTHICITLPQRVNSQQHDDVMASQCAVHLWGESTGNRWIPLTKGSVMQSCGVLFDVRLNMLLIN